MNARSAASSSSFSSSAKLALNVTVPHSPGAAVTHLLIPRLFLLFRPPTPTLTPPPPLIVCPFTIHCVDGEQKKEKEENTKKKNICHGSLEFLILLHFFLACVTRQEPSKKAVGEACLRWEDSLLFFFLSTPPQMTPLPARIPACKFRLVGNDIFMRKLKCERRVWGFVSLSESISPTLVPTGVLVPVTPAGEIHTHKKREKIKENCHCF